MANLLASSILGNSCREFPPLNIVNDDEFPIFYIHTSSLEPYKNLIPILIAGRVEKISKISDKDFSSYKAVLSVSSSTYNVINSETPLSFLKTITTLNSSYYFKGIVERNSTYYGNSNILIDSNFNVLYLACYNRETSHTVFLVNKEALISYGALSKAILGSLITSLSASYLETSFALAKFPNEAGDPKVYSKLDNITIVNETNINSFISRFPLLDSNVTDEYITESIKQRFDLNKIMDNMFLG